jgi:hypothetical protein
MLTTHKAIQNASTASALQLYSIKVEETKLVWPLHVYGMVAARDPVDRNRNILFNRKRDNCQILTEEVCISPLISFSLHRLGFFL